MHILRFLLEHTVFQNVLQDLDMNVLYIEEGHNEQQTIAMLKPKCLFLAHSFEEGKILIDKVQPQIVIIYISQASQVDFVKELFTSDISFIIVWSEEVTPQFVDLIKLGIRNIVLPPITPQSVLAEVQKSMYELSLVKQVMLQQELLQMIFDFQNDLFLILEDDEIIDCNTNFLRFFGYEDLMSYHEQHMTFAEYFAQENGYYIAENNTMWIDDCLTHARKIKMYNEVGEGRVFLLRIAPLPNDVSRFIATCTDITELEEDYKEQERLATTDSLTNIYNRMKFQRLFSEGWETALRMNQSFALVLFDLDNFKQVNDTYGYDFGDLALVQLTELVTAKLQPHHVFARWGGEEFVLFLSQVTEKEAFQIAESIRFFIETKKISGISKITASFGVAAFENGITKEMLMHRADVALYEAKKKGKNQVCLYRKEKM
ncbi:sensor domain-containing diguanylate cyclase [Bacillus sp. WLY-B-L8]|uniref:sensor domain-containing diguanylate cyclase n=1 Tax=Bacillus multifaciens TaxID=3068506 RepID=UPI0027427661|nr:sensor domain-containing diguanylate cyclase [Bacillus sp. WLY-B-L8]MDP7976973.1 sensor domain-containing diguanylate cyclase [Bacillus sp. WLY-B-L8]